MYVLLLVTGNRKKLQDRVQWRESNGDFVTSDIELASLAQPLQKYSFKTLPMFYLKHYVVRIYQLRCRERKPQHTSMTQIKGFYSVLILTVNSLFARSLSHYKILSQLHTPTLKSHLTLLTIMSTNH